MKIFIFVACLLIVTFAHDPEKVKAHYETYWECATELGIPRNQITARGLKCVADKENMYNEENVIKKDILLAYAEKLFITGFEEQGKEILSKCVDKIYQGPGNNDEKSIAFIECSLKQNILDITAKPEE